MADENIIDATNLPVTVPAGGSILDPEQMMKNAIARAEIVEKMRTLAIMATFSGDWVDYGDKPGIDGPGAERIARTIGLIAFDLDASTEDLPGNEYIIYIRGKLGFPSGEYIEVMGSCCSTKPFFKAKADSNNTKVDPGDIHKNAITNFYVNGVSRFLGLRGLSWEDLKEISDGKILREKAQKIEYGSAKEVDRSEGDEEKLGNIWNWLLEMNGGVVADAKKQLAHLTTFGDFTGYTNYKKISSKSLPITYKRVDAAYKEWIRVQAKGGKQ